MTQIRTFAAMIRTGDGITYYGIYRGRIYAYGTPRAHFRFNRYTEQVATVALANRFTHDLPTNTMYTRLAAPYATPNAPVIDWTEATGRR